jgi:hypothetical protein
VTKTLDTTFPYKGYGRFPSRCRLRTYIPSDRQEQRHDAPAVVVLTQSLDDPGKGTSLTNAVEDVANTVWRSTCMIGA